MAGPITLSYDKFLKTKYGLQGRAGYKKYQAYIKSARTPKAKVPKPPARRGLGDFPVVQAASSPPVAQTPSSPNSPYFYGGGGTNPQLPPPPGAAPRAPGRRPPTATDPYAGIPAGLRPTSAADQRAQAMAYINAVINPILDRIRREYAAGLQNAQGATTGYTTALVNELRPVGVRIAETYGGLADSSTQGGQALQDASKQQQAGPIGALSHYAQLSGAPQSIVNAAAARGEQVGRVLAALHSAQASDLAAGHEAFQGQADALPGIAALRGLQMLGDYTLQSTKARDSQLADLNNQIPSMLMQLMNQNQDRELQKAAAILNYKQYLTGQNLTTARTVLGQNAQTQRTLIQQRNENQRNAARIAAQALRTARSDQVRWQQLLTQASKIYGRPVIDFDKYGNPIGQDHKVITTIPQKTGTKGTASIKNLAQKQYDNAYNIAFYAKYGYRPTQKPPSQNAGGVAGAAIAKLTGLEAKSPQGWIPQTAQQAYRSVYSYLVGAGVDPVAARIQALRLLQTVGYPVRADLIPPNAKGKGGLPPNKGGIR